MSARAEADDCLRQLAENAGILARWHDLSGQEQQAGPETQRALLRAMGLQAESTAETRETLAALEAERTARRLPEEVVLTAGERIHIPLANPAAWRLELESGEVQDGRAEEAVTMTPAAGLHRLVVGDQSCLIIAAPARVPAIEACLRPGRRRAWGAMAALYGLRSLRSLGIGDYRDLAEAAEQLAALGADFIGINPVHARGAANPGISPYSPSCRSALEPRHIAVDCVPGFADCAAAQQLLNANAERMAAVKTKDLLDYPLHDAIHGKLLRALFDHFEATQPGPAAEFADWRMGAGAAVEGFAHFEALSLRRGADWRHWPEALHSPRAAAVLAFAAEQPDELRYHAWLQWLAERQLAAAQKAARDAGMAYGLYLDLAVGVRPGGADSWADATCFAHGVSLGAPPDAFNPAGQDWSLAPFNPRGLRQAGYRPFVRMLRLAMRHAGIIRIDHILGIKRCFWVPGNGTPGGYVRYPMATLLALIRLEAARSGCVVVGEDLGSVPEGLRDELADAGLLGCAVMQFEKEGDAFRPPEDYRPATLASFATHDTPTLRGWWEGRDIVLRRDLGQITLEAAAAAQAQRRVERIALARLLARHGLLPAGCDAEAPPEDADEEFTEALHALLAHSPSGLLALQLDDALGVVAQQNLPGTVDTYPNWRRRYPIAVEDFATHRGLRGLATLWNEALRGPPAEEEKQQWL